MLVLRNMMGRRRGRKKKKWIGLPSAPSISSETLLGDSYIVMYIIDQSLHGYIIGFRSNETHDEKV